jgi:hypothetical protein
MQIIQNPLNVPRHMIAHIRLQHLLIVHIQHVVEEVSVPLIEVKTGLSPTKNSVGHGGLNVAESGVADETTFVVVARSVRADD